MNSYKVVIKTKPIVLTIQAENEQEAITSALFSKEFNDPAHDIHAELIASFDIFKEIDAIHDHYSSPINYGGSD